MSRKTCQTFPKLLESFFVRRMVNQRHASPNTVRSYRDTFRLLLRFVQDRLRRAPSKLQLADVDAPLVATFLDHLENERANSVSSRNARLAAVHSFFRFALLEEPSAVHACERVLAIPRKRAKKRVIDFLEDREVEALLAAPALDTWSGRRDRGLLLLAVQGGFRVSELTALDVQDVVLGRAAHVRCRGKGRKDRCTPLRRDVARVLRDWLRERGGQPSAPLFPNARSGRLSRDGVAYLLAKHVNSAVTSCASLRRKRVTPHVLRHTAAMMLLHAGVDRSVIALWLGHETSASTEPYIHADLKLKERAVSRTTPLRVPKGRYRPSDPLLSFLERL